MNFTKILVAFIICSKSLSAQDTAVTKSYCTLKVLGTSPFKVISVGYDFQSANTLSTNNKITTLTPLSTPLGSSEKNNIQNNQGLRLAANFPVLSKKRCLILVGFSYLENNYNFSGAAPVNPLAATLNDNGLRSMGASYAVFIPLDATHFILNQSNFDLSGDYNLHDFQPLSTTTISSALLFGWKPNERSQIGLGLSRTYRGGEQSYVPVLLYNYTFQNRKWGIESLLPARAALRYTVNEKNILLAGFLLEGNSYYLGNLMKNNPEIAYKQLELKRSELRIRVIYECAIYKSIWLSLQAGYRINSKFNVDDGDFYRGFSDKPYLMENTLTNPFYATIAINLVAP
jgi:hypothetical protein